MTRVLRIVPVLAIVFAIVFVIAFVIGACAGEVPAPTPIPELSEPTVTPTVVPGPVSTSRGPAQGQPENVPTKNVPTKEEAAIELSDALASYFRETASEVAVTRSGGAPIEGLDAFLLQQVLPSLTVEDFRGVEAVQGSYEVIGGELTFREQSEQPLHSAAMTLSADGWKTLLANTSRRLGIAVEGTESVEALIEMLSRGTEIPQQPKEEVPSVPEATVLIRVHNVSDTDFDQVVAFFPAQQVNYGEVAQGEMSEYRTVVQAYRFVHIEVSAAGENYVVRPYDYVGEEQLAPGHYTYRLNVEQGRLGVELVED